MALTAATIIARFIADTTGFSRGAQEVRSSLDDISNAVASGVFKGNMFTQAANGIVNLGRAAFGAYASNERLGMSLQALVKKELLATGAFTDGQALMSESSRRAQDLLAWNQRLAIASPFSQEGVAEAFRMAQAYGFNATAAATVEEAQQKGIISAQRMTQAMIDFASGSGQTEFTMKRIALALGQIQAKGKLAGGEVLQLTEAGLNVRQILADAMGVTTAKVVELQEKGLIPANLAIQAIVTSLERDFGGAASAQSGSAAGLINSLQDLAIVAQREFFTPVFQQIQPVMAEFASALADPAVIASLREMGGAIGAFLGEALKMAPQVIGAVRSIAGPLATAGAQIITAVLSPFQGAIAALGTALNAQLPNLTTGIQQGAAGLAGALGALSQGAVTAGGAVVMLGQNIQAVLWPAIIGVTGATIAWNMVSGGAVVAAIGSAIHTISLAAQVIIGMGLSYVTAAGQALAAAGSFALANAAILGPLALITAAVAGVAIAYNNYQMTLAEGAQAIQANTAGNQAAAQAITTVGQASMETRQALQGNVEQIQAMQAAQEQHLAGLANTIAIMEMLGFSQEAINATYDEGIAKAREMDAAILQLSNETQGLADVKQLETVGFADANGAYVAAREGALALAGADERAAEAAAEEAAARQAATQAMLDDIQAKDQSQLASMQLADMQSVIAGLSDQVAAGHITAGQAAVQLASMYNIAIGKARELIGLHNQVAGAAGVGRMGSGSSEGGPTSQLKREERLYDGRVAGRRDSELSGTEKRDNYIAQLEQNADAAQRAREAERELAEAQRAGIMATGSHAQRLSLLRSELSKLTPGTAEYVRKQTELAQAQSAAAKGGGKKVSEEQKTQDALARVLEQGGNRLVEIDQRIAQRRLQAYQELQRQILNTSYQMTIGWERNDLEIVAASEERARELIPREKAEAEARVRQIEYVQQARETAAQGDAETAREVLSLQTDYNKERAALDEDYYKYQQELADDPARLAQLKEQYDQVVALQDSQLGTEIELAQASAEERKKADQEARDEAISAATDQANRIKDASDDQRSQVISDLQAQASALDSFASSWETAAARVSSAADRAAGAAGRVQAADASTGGGAGAGSTDSTGGGGAVDHLARGGTAKVGQVTLVGEEGPELVVFGQAAQVIPAGPTSRLLRGGMADGGTVLGSGGDGQAVAEERAGGAKGRRGSGKSKAQLDAEYRARQAAILQAEEFFLHQREQINDRHFWYELQRDERRERRAREVARFQEQQTAALDAKVDARRAEILAEWMGGAQSAEELVAVVRLQAAERTARALAATDERIGRERNASLAALDQQYQQRALAIVEEGQSARNDVESFWYTVQLADLSANQQQERQLVMDDYQRKLDRELQLTQQIQDEIGRAEEQAAQDQAADLEDRAREQAEAEFQAQRDELEMAQWREDRVQDRIWNQFDDVTQSTIDQEMEAFLKAWEARFAAIGGADRFKELTGGRAAGGPVGPYRSYLVGEQGPEILTMGKQGGFITPNHALGGGVVVNVDARGSTGIDLRQVEEAARRGAQRGMDEAAQRAAISRRTGTYSGR